MSKLKEDFPYEFSLIRPKTLAKILGVSIPTLYRRIKEPDFPNKVKLSNGAVGFKRGDVEGYIESRTVSRE